MLGEIDIFKVDYATLKAFEVDEHDTLNELVGQRVSVNID